MAIDLQRVQSLFLRVVAFEPSEREQILSDECGGDDELRQRVEALLLANDNPGSFLDAPQIEVPFTEESNPALGVTLDSDGSAKDAATSEFRLNIRPGVTINDRFVLQKKIGEGGMGEVWVAKQLAPVKRSVALKLIKLGMDSRAVITRFEQERQALAMMDHPNIAKVLDAGMTSSGQPFFVMELINGLPVTKYCDQAKLSPSERLPLFVTICQAVQHAHQKGIVHRDLKPANILVTMIDGKPIPKVIDFGVAKATGGKLTDGTLSTAFGAVVGTLEYMSPEQAGYSGVDIDTRADIYSLGVILYELLTGLRPIDSARLRCAAIGEMIRIIQEDVPPRPSTRVSTDESLPSIAAVRQTDPKKLTSMLRGELDWVVMKCLEKSRDRRYGTASGLAQDIERYLGNEPVEARPPSTSYRVQKLLQRNKGPAIAIGLLFLSLLAGMIGTTWGLLEARRQTAIAREEAAAKELARVAEQEQRTRAEESEQEAQREVATQLAINSFFRDDVLAQASSFAQSDTILQPNPDLKVRTALERAATNIDERFAAQPLVGAAIRSTIGTAFMDLGEFDAAQTHLKKAVRLYTDQLGRDDLASIDATRQLALLYLQRNELDDAVDLLERVRQGYQRLFGDDDRRTLAAVHDLANGYHFLDISRGMPEKTQLAKQLLLETLQAQRTLFGEKDADVRESLNSLAMLYRHLSKGPEPNDWLDQADKLLQQALDLCADLPDSNPLKLQILNNLANIAGDKLEYERAQEIMEKVLAGCKSAFGEVHPNTARAMDAIAMTYNVRSRHAEAENLYLQALELRRSIYGNDHPVTEHTITAIANFYISIGANEKALPFYVERVERSARVNGPNAIDTHLAKRDLASIYSGLERSEEAEKMFEEAIQGLKQYKPDNDPIMLLTRQYFADHLFGKKRFEEAEEVYREVVKQIKSQPSPPPMLLGQALGTFGRCLIETGKFDEAEKTLREADRIAKQYVPDIWPGFFFQFKVGVALAGQEKFAEAEPLMLDAMEKIQASNGGMPPHLVLESLMNLEDLYTAWGKESEAERWKKEREDFKDGQ